MKKIRKTILKALAKFNNHGNAFIDIAVKIGVGVVVGSLVISFFDENVNEVLGAIFTKIEEVIQIPVE